MVYPFRDEMQDIALWEVQAVHVCGRVDTLVTCACVLPAQEVELAVTLLYHLGEGASEEALKPGTGLIAQLATGVAATSCPPPPANVMHRRGSGALVSHQSSAVACCTSRP